MEYAVEYDEGCCIESFSTLDGAKVEIADLISSCGYGKDDIELFELHPIPFTIEPITINLET